VSAEVAAMEVEGMLAEGRKLAASAPNVVVKVPLTKNGLIATSEFAHEGIQTNVTLCFSATQAMMPANAGASHISPFSGRPGGHGPVDPVGLSGDSMTGQAATKIQHAALQAPRVKAFLRAHPETVRDDAELLAQLGLRVDAANLVDFGPAALARVSAAHRRES